MNLIVANTIILKVRTDKRTVLNPVLANNKFHKNLEHPLPTPPMTPTSVRN